MSTVPVDVAAYRKDLGKEREELAKHLIAGKCADYAEYKEKTGRIRGIDSALDKLKDILQRSEEDDDSD